VNALIGGDMSLDVIVECRDRLAAVADLAAYTTAAAADDLDDVRRWLGFGRVNVYGSSYGTRLALAYAQRYSQYVRSITVKGPMPASLRNPLNVAADSQAALDRLFADCRTEAACMGAFPKLREDFDAVLARLSTDPPRIPLRNGGTVTLTRDIFSGVIRRMLYSAESQRAIPLTIAAAARGAYAPLLPVLGAGEAIDRALNVGLFLSVTCAEDVSRYDEAAMKTATARTFSGDALASRLLAACRIWPKARAGNELDRPVRGRVPALIMSGAFDPQTPPRWGREMAKLLPGARTIEAEGLAHTGTPPCLAEVFESFVVSGSATALDTSCLKELRREPFTLPK
jgi:pimeloyl-ACP methyl ester carboxylesterase